MKIGFYLDKKNLDNINCYNILNGNPGLGGSEYEFLLVSYLLENRDNEIEPILFVHSKLKVPHKNVKIVYGGITGLCDVCVEEGISLLVINQGQFDKAIFDIYSKQISLILWAHNVIPYSKLSLIDKLPYVKRIVCCGREMLELFRDHSVSRKSTYVYNIFPIHEKEWYEGKIDFSDNHNVAYMGMLHQGKGFHVLARSWKDILKKVPDAQLYVIGSGKLYDKNAKLGKYGIASEEFENLIMPYLEDEAGKLLPNVHFMGLMGVEKYEVLGKCKVAVPNPTGCSECLPITSIEMQLMGCNITTIRHPAYLDTVGNHTYLYKKTSDIVEYISKRLLAPRDDYQDTYNFITEKFCMRNSISRWEHIIYTIDKKMQIEPYSCNSFQIKSLKNFMLYVKLKFPFLCILPPIEKFYNFYRDRISKYNQ